MITYPRIARCFGLVATIVAGTLTSKAQTFDVPLNNQFVAMYSSSVSQAISTGSWVILNFNLKEADTNNAVTTGAAWSFTAPDTAYIRIDASVRWVAKTSTAGNYESLAVFKNGSYLKVLNFQYGPVLGYGTSHTLNGNTVIRVQSGDVIDLRVWHTGTTASTSATQGETWVTIARVR